MHIDTKDIFSNEDEFFDSLDDCLSGFNVEGEECCEDWSGLHCDNCNERIEEGNGRSYHHIEWGVKDNKFTIKLIKYKQVNGENEQEECQYSVTIDEYNTNVAINWIMLYLNKGDTQKGLLEIRTIGKIWGQ